MSLAKIIQAGFPSSNGFYVSTEAYHQFLAINGLQMEILIALKDVDFALLSTFFVPGVAAKTKASPENFVMEMTWP